MTNYEALRRKIQIVRELEILLSAKRRLVTKDSFSKFIDVYLSHLATHRPPQFHGEMKGFLEQMIRGKGYDTPQGAVADKRVSLPYFSDINSKVVLTDKDSSVVVGHRLLFIAPRGFGKSFVCSVFFPLWLALFQKKKDVFLVSSTIALARDLLRKIRNELENNEKILADFGDLKSEKWTEDMLVLSNGVVLRAKGRGFQIRGFRPDLIVCDDLEDEEIIYSKEQRDKLENWFFRTILPALKPDQDLVYVGTMIHRFSLMAKLREKEEFLVRFYQALTEDKSIWEELWPTETLKRLKKEMGSYAFEAEYQNNPISLSDQPIKPHYLEGVRIFGERIASCLAVDPAISMKTSSDPRAFVLLERTSEGFKEVWSEAGRWSVEEQVEKIIQAYLDHKPDRIVLEEVAFQKVFRMILVARAREKKIYLPVTTARLGISPKDTSKRPKDKFTRLMAVVHLFEQRLVEIVNPELKEQLLTFPSGDHDDLVDATVFALDWLVNYQTGRTFIKKQEQPVVEAKAGFFVEQVSPGVFITKIGTPVIKLKSNVINFDQR